MGSVPSSQLDHYQEVNDREDDLIEKLSLYKLIWIDQNVNSTENVQKQLMIENLSEDLLVFDNFKEGKEKIEEMKLEKVFVILNGDMNNFEDFILNIHSKNGIAIIYLYTKHYQTVRQLLRPIKKVKYVEKTFDIIYKKFSKDLNIYQNNEYIRFIPIGTNSSKIHFYILKHFSTLLNDQLNDQSQKILFKTYENYYGSENATIKRFRESFNVENSLDWFVKEYLISRLFNKICSKGYFSLLFHFEYLIKCLFIKLKEEHALFIKNLNQKFDFYVYIGQLINIYEFKRLKMLIGKDILLTRFLLANFDQNQIKANLNELIPSSNELCFIYKILINVHSKGKQPFTKINLNNEDYLLFMFGSTFTLLDSILNPHDQYPTILLKLSNKSIQSI